VIKDDYLMTLGSVVMGYSSREGSILLVGGVEELLHGFGEERGRGGW
jgi:hypothetical protein